MKHYRVVKCPHMHCVGALYHTEVDPLGLSTGRRAFCTEQEVVQETKHLNTSGVLYTAHHHGEDE
jgi:hypothetical protein